jgi:hypothetical protein
LLEFLATLAFFILSTDRIANIEDIAGVNCAQRAEIHSSCARGFKEGEIDGAELAVGTELFVTLYGRARKRLCGEGCVGGVFRAPDPGVDEKFLDRVALARVDGRAPIESSN